MDKASSEHARISIEDLRKIRGHRLLTLKRSTHKIPISSGIYIWRYWPTFTSLEPDNIIDSIERIQNTFPVAIENLYNSRLSVNVQRTAFGNPKVHRIFGINDESKIRNFMDLVNSDESARLVLTQTLEIIIAFSSPLYIGKADNLQKRLIDHFEYKTRIMNMIDESDISHEDIYISFIFDELSVQSAKVTTTIEEILQRITNPSFTKRYG